MNARATLQLGILLAALLLSTTVWADRGTKVAEAIWVDDVIYGTVITDTNFHLPPAQSTDTIYSFMMSGLGGQRSIAESAPGDRDFNGGRWSVKLAVFTDLGKSFHDPDGNGMVNFELTNDVDLMNHVDLGHIVLVDTGFYFECPLLPNN